MPWQWLDYPAIWSAAFSAPLPTRAARNSGQVLPALNLRETLLHQERAHRISLVVTMLQQQPGAGQQVRWGLCNDLAQVVQPIGAGCQGFWWLVHQGTQVRICAGDIRRIACDNMVVTADFLKPITLNQLHICL